jgi:hypothetical protein
MPHCRTLFDRLSLDADLNKHYNHRCHSHGRG